jgi:hypothetical protein
MNNVTNLVSFFAALSVATERITEIIKGFPGLSGWFAATTLKPASEEFRKVSVQIVAVLAGGVVSYVVREPLAKQLSFPDASQIPFWWYLVFGAMASGGSGIWNSALDIVREVNKQKQLVTDKLAKTV